MEGIKVTWRHKPNEVRQETARRTKNDNWKGEDRWWSEFLDARKRFLVGKAIPNSVIEYVELERQFGDWVKMSPFWWGGDWACKKEGDKEENDLAVWHVRRYVSARKQTGKPVISDQNVIPQSAFLESGQGTSAPKSFFDPVLDEFRQIE